MSVIPGLPPLPACFSGLMGSDTSQWRETGKFLSESVNTQSESSAEEAARDDSALYDCEVQRNDTERDTDRSLCNGENVSPFCQLNSTLTKLRKEMVRLLTV